MGKTGCVVRHRVCDEVACAVCVRGGGRKRHQRKEA
jgi:hypothetical protein